MEKDERRMSWWIASTVLDVLLAVAILIVCIKPTWLKHMGLEPILGLAKPLESNIKAWLYYLVSCMLIIGVIVINCLGSDLQYDADFEHDEQRHLIACLVAMPTLFMLMATQIYLWPEIVSIVRQMGDG